MDVQKESRYVFKMKKGYYPEDDTRPFFFNFCDELLNDKSDNRVAHISGCNLHSNAVNFKESYVFNCYYGVGYMEKHGRIMTSTCFLGIIAPLLNNWIA